MTTVDEYLQAQRAEWGKYVATEPIYIGGVRAFNAGDPVPASHVESGTVSAEVVELVVAAEPEQPVDLTPPDPQTGAGSSEGDTPPPSEGADAATPDAAPVKRSSRKGN